MTCISIDAEHTQAVRCRFGIKQQQQQQGINHGEAALLWICLSEFVKLINPVRPSFGSGTNTSNSVLLQNGIPHCCVCFSNIFDNNCIMLLWPLWSNI